MHATDLFWYPLKTTGNLCFPDVFKSIKRKQWHEMGKQILSLFILSHILDYHYHKMSLQTRKPKSLCHILRYPFSTVAKLKKIELKNKVPSTNSSKLFSFTESRNKDYLSIFFYLDFSIFPRNSNCCEDIFLKILWIMAYLA